MLDIGAKNKKNSWTISFFSLPLTTFLLMLCTEIEQQIPSSLGTFSDAVLIQMPPAKTSFELFKMQLQVIGKMKPQGAFQTSLNGCYHSVFAFQNLKTKVSKNSAYILFFKAYIRN